MRRKTQIIASLGPASCQPETIAQMAQAGMDLARLNCSHMDHHHLQDLICSIREVNQQLGRKVQILQDLEGYRLRVGNMENPQVLEKHQEVRACLEGDDVKGDIPLEFDEPMDSLRQGMDVFIDDGRIWLNVIEEGGKYVKLKVLHGGLLKPRKGVNIPELKLKKEILTDKDKKDIFFGIINKVDYIAQSFVRNRDDILRIVELVKPHLPDCKIIAKVENQEGVDNIDDIIAAADGIMIARGDLGVSLPLYQVPIIQKDIIWKCNQKKKMVITATQMLEGMIDGCRPTRAEVSDVANAILDGTNFVMLSGETTVGAFPVHSVDMMRQIIDFTEEFIDSNTGRNQLDCAASC